MSRDGSPTGLRAVEVVAPEVDVAAKRVAFEKISEPPTPTKKNTPSKSSKTDTMKVLVKPSFPKAAVSMEHIEMRAGWRISTEKQGEDSGDVTDTGDSSDGSNSPPPDGGSQRGSCAPGVPVNYNLGLGVNTGAGVKDGSLELKALGCGMRFGKNLGFSLLDNEISLDMNSMKKMFGLGGGHDYNYNVPDENEDSNPSQQDTHDKDILRAAIKRSRTWNWAMSPQK